MIIVYILIQDITKWSRKKVIYCRLLFVKFFSAKISRKVIILVIILQMLIFQNLSFKQDFIKSSKYGNQK